jgi:hypothetical protein
VNYASAWCAVVASTVMFKVMTHTEARSRAQRRADGRSLLTDALVIGLRVQVCCDLREPGALEPR